jgi:hypothetical protein
MAWRPASIARGGRNVPGQWATERQRAPAPIPYFPVYHQFKFTAATAGAAEASVAVELP